MVTITSGAQWELGYTYATDKIPGAAGAQAVLVVPEHSPDTLWYYSGTEQGTTKWKDMGWKVRIEPKLTANESKTGSQDKLPFIPIQAAEGAIANAHPNIKLAVQVNLLVKGYMAR